MNSHEAFDLAGTTRNLSLADRFQPEPAFWGLRRGRSTASSWPLAREVAHQRFIEVKFALA
jgi:hypothetical protein